MISFFSLSFSFFVGIYVKKGNLTILFGALLWKTQTGKSSLTA